MKPTNKEKENVFGTIILLLIVIILVIFIILGIYKNKYRFTIIDKEIELGISDTYDVEIFSKDYEKANYIFISSDENIATVDENGKITALKEGIVEITIKSKKGFNKEIIKLNVNSVGSSIKFLNNTYALKKGTSQKVELVSNGPIDFANVVWNISDTSIVTVDSGGTIYAHKTGEVTLTATLNNFEAKCKIIVQNDDVEPTSIIFKEKNIELSLGNTYNLGVKILPENATNKYYTLSSSNNNVVEISNDVLITKQTGTVIITATLFNGITTTCNVKVVEILPESIGLSKTAVTINTGDTYNLTATIKPSNTSNKNITWTSSNNEIATVVDGKITTYKEGTAKITATTTNGKKATCTITVKKVNIKPTSIKLNKTSVNLTVGETTSIIATILPENATNKSIVWTSSDNSIAEINNGKITAKKAGTAKITAKITNTSLSATLTVKVINQKVTGITLNQSNGVIYTNNANKSVNLQATVYPANAYNKEVTWTSSNTNVATVSKGVVTAINPGTATITATTQDGGHKATYNLMVKKKVIVVITASQGIRMDKWFETYTSKNGNYYSKADNTLKYQYLGGSGFEYQYGDGLNEAIDYINKQFSSLKNYIELNIYFTLTGNSVKYYTCDQIGTSSEYNDIASKYNTSIQKIKNLGYIVNGFVITHSPLNTKHPLASKNNIVYSHKEEACKSKYRSAWKYHLSNERMKKVLSGNSYPNIKIIDNWSNFLVVTDAANRKFKWLQPFSTPEDDALHWDEPTTKLYMQLAFDTANM